MKQWVSPWRLSALLLLGSGCAAQPPMVSLATTGAVAIQREPSAEAPQGSPVAQPEALPLPQPVSENQTFVTLEGVPRYKIGPGDVLEILLARGLAQERQTVAVKANGMVTVAFVEAKVAGRTTEQAAEEIRQKLSPFYKELGVEVLVKEYNSKRVTVLGALVGKAGAFPLKGKMTVLDLLAEVGGPAPDADLERVRLIRQDGPSLTVSFSRLLSEGQVLVLDTGDVLFIPRLTAEEKKTEEKKVFVLGEVRTPGAFSLLPNMRLSQLLAMAGGPTDQAVLKSARIVRGGASNPQFIEADFQKVLEQGDQSQDLRLQANDVIVLPRSGIGNWNAFLAKLRPSLEFLTLPLQPVTQYLLLQQIFAPR